MLSYWLQGSSEGSIGHGSLPFASSLALASLTVVALVGFVTLPPLLLALQQAGTLLEDLVLKGANDADEMLHVLQVHLHSPEG